MHKIIEKLKNVDKNKIFIVIAVVVVLATGLMISAKSNSAVGKILSYVTPGMSADVVAKKSVEYLNKSVLQQGQTATLVSSSQESGVIKFTIKIADKTYDSYATKDGKLIFPEALKADAAANPASATK